VSSRGARDLEDLEVVFAALAHASRRHILLVLHHRGGVMTAGDIAARFDCSWPTTTRHLRVLEDAGLLTVETCGRERHYRLDRERLRRVASAWLAPSTAPDSSGNRELLGAACPARAPMVQ
jgi:DNA-binding transcriptional ArsR family regulator